MDKLKVITKFLKNYKCKQAHPMMLQNRIPKGTTAIARRSMNCKVCGAKIKEQEKYISCLKCNDFYCHEHISIRKVNDMDELREKLGFVNKKLKL